MDVRGAHTKNHNKNSIGICFVGNYDEVYPPESMWNLGLELVSFLCGLYNIPKENVFGHREFASYKSCPGNLWDLDRFRGEL